MLECKYCHHPFPTVFSRTQHLRQKAFCNRAYKRELVTLASQTRVWQVDDPEDMPSDMEDDRLESADEVLDDTMERQGREAGDEQGNEHASLFEQYLATITTKSLPESATIPVGWWVV